MKKIFLTKEIQEVQEVLKKIGTNNIIHKDCKELINQINLGLEENKDTIRCCATCRNAYLYHEDGLYDQIYIHFNINENELNLLFNKLVNEFIEKYKDEPNPNEPNPNDNEFEEDQIFEEALILKMLYKYKKK